MCTATQVRMYCASNGGARVLSWIMLRFTRTRLASELNSSLSDAPGSKSGASTSGGDWRCDTEASNKKRKPGDYRRLWHPEWETTYLVSYNKTDTYTCLKCNCRIDTVKKYNLQRHCESMHPDTKEWSDKKGSFLYSRQNKSWNKCSNVFHRHSSRAPYHS